MSEKYNLDVHDRRAIAKHLIEGFGKDVTDYDSFEQHAHDAVGAVHAAQCGPSYDDLQDIKRTIDESTVLIELPGVETHARLLPDDTCRSVAEDVVLHGGQGEDADRISELIGDVLSTFANHTEANEADVELIEKLVAAATVIFPDQVD